MCGVVEWASRKKVRTFSYQNWKKVRTFSYQNWALVGVIVVLFRTYY